MMKLVVPVGLAGLVIYAAAHLIGSPTPSIAAGWYWRHSGKPTVAKGQLVLLDPPTAVQALVAVINPAYETVPWVKRIVGLEGDMVCYGERVTINGKDYGPRPLIRMYPEVQVHVGCHQIPLGQILVLGTHSYSFDGRYIGPMAATQLRANVSPVWTWERQP